MFEIHNCHYCSVDAHAKISILFLLVSSLGADPFTVLFSHVVES